MDFVPNLPKELLFPPDAFAITVHMIDEVSVAYYRVLAVHGEEPEIMNVHQEVIKSMVEVKKLLHDVLIAIEELHAERVYAPRHIEQWRYTGNKTISALSECIDVLDDAIEWGLEFSSDEALGPYRETLIEAGHALIEWGEKAKKMVKEPIKKPPMIDVEAAAMAAQAKSLQGSTGQKRSSTTGRFIASSVKKSLFDGV